MLNSRQLLRNGPAILFLALTALLTACGGKAVSSAVCSGENLRAAANLSPHDVVVDASKPVTLSWTYSDPACMPDHYEVTLGTSPEGGAPGSAQTSQSTALNWPGALTQGTTYFWTVYPVAYNNGQPVRGPGQLGYFYTGPVCAADAALLAPIAIFPLEGTSLDPSVAITLRWDDPTNCLPNGNYSVEISLLLSRLSGEERWDERSTDQRVPPGWAAHSSGKLRCSCAPGKRFLSHRHCESRRKPSVAL